MALSFCYAIFAFVAALSQAAILPQSQQAGSIVCVDSSGQHDVGSTWVDAANFKQQCTSGGIVKTIACVDPTTKDEIPLNQDVLKNNVMHHCWENKVGAYSYSTTTTGNQGQDLGIGIISGGQFQAQSPKPYGGST